MHGNALAGGKRPVLSSAEVGSSLLRFGAATPARTFVMAPCAGGSAYAYTEWLPHLLRDGDAAMVVKYPNRGIRPDEPTATIAAITDRAAGDLRRYANGPFVVIGHSLGGLIAYELTTRLQRQDCEVRLLVVSSARPPGSIATGAKAVASMNTGEWESELRRQGMLDAETLAEPGLLDMVIPVLRADYLMLSRYEDSGGMVACPVYAICGSDDPHVSPDDMALWRERARGQFIQNIFPGEHFYFLMQLEKVCHSILELAGPG
jgi:pyochelin biosynthesis protein PchC